VNLCDVTDYSYSTNFLHSDLLSTYDGYVDDDQSNDGDDKRFYENFQ
jgi:hypothetical protein